LESWGESFKADKRALRKNADRREFRKNADRREFIKNEKIDRITN